ncbi:MAG: hypothetical protein QOG60_2767 [Frankiaceae bacterium]|jgi:hypothetical protein|nr:hypothetical protein [Frankiaceae bacterium]
MPPANKRAFFVTNMVANRVLIPVLRSRAGRRLGRQLAVVEYVGRRSGQPHRLVTQYAVDGPTVRISVGMWERKTWWRNFRAPQPLHLRLAGVEHEATAHVERVGDQVYVVAELAR